MTNSTNIHEPTGTESQSTVPTNGKLTAREKKWIVYDVGNSAFVLLSTAVIPIYAKSLMPADGNIVSAWGYAQTIASLVIALLMPLLGSIADVQGMKIKFFLGFFGTGVVTCCAMALPLTWLPFLIVYILATIGLNGSLTFYDSMLIDTTSNERMDKVSSHGYGWGYIGSTVPFILCIALIFGGPALFGWSTAACTRASFIITVKNKPLWMFMIAFFFYIDAVNTVISMSTSYGAELGIDSTQLVVALLVTQFVAFPCAILYGRLSGRFGSKTMITAAVVAYMCIVFFAAFFLKSAAEFWILAILVGMFQGGIQALSRSYYGKIIPKDHANEYYGFYDIFGKSASILGSFMVATVTTITGNPSLGVLSIGVLLVLALVFLVLQKDPMKA